MIHHPHSRADRRKLAAVKKLSNVKPKTSKKEQGHSEVRHKAELLKEEEAYNELREAFV